MMKRIQAGVLVVVILCCSVGGFSGCTLTFTEGETLQFSLSEPAPETVSVVADFEAGEADNVAGDVTQQSGSVCAGGACIIY